MKRLFLYPIFVVVFTNLIYANNLAQKIVKFHNTIFNNAINFVAKESKNGYEITIKPISYPYNTFLKDNATIHIAVDEGPLILNPSFGIGKAGLEANIDILNILNSDIAIPLKRKFKDGLKYKYIGKISFDNDLDESFEFKPINLINDDTNISISKGKFNISSNLDEIKPTFSANIDYIKLTPTTNLDSYIEFDNIKYVAKATNPPVENYLLFVDSKIDFGKIIIKYNDRGLVYVEGSLSLVGNIEKVNETLSNFTLKEEFKTANKDTIALFKGVKSNSFEFSLKSVGTKGLIGLIKLQEEQDNIQQELIKASKNNDDIAMQKAIIKMSELSNKFVYVFNDLLIGGKSKIVSTLKLNSDNTSYIKLDLLYKGKPLSGNITSALILLGAQGLNLFDGNIEAKIDSNLANSINPMSSLILGMLQSKGLIKMKNGIYELKAKLKDGKVIINNKSYTLQELSATLLQ